MPKPYSPPFSITSTVLHRVAEIGETLGRWTAHAAALPAPHLRRAQRARMIQASLAIENNSLTLEQVTAVIDGRRVLAPPRDVHEVRNAFAAYERLPHWRADSLADLKHHCFIGFDRDNQSFRSAGAFAKSLTREDFGFRCDSDVAQLAALCARYDAGLILDEAHAIGVHGPSGRGIAASAAPQAAASLPCEIIAMTHTCGKALASVGAFLANNQMKVVKATVKGLGACFKGSKYTKARYMELMALMYDNPFMNAIMTFIEPFPVGLVVTLISAALLRKKPRPQAA